MTRAVLRVVLRCVQSHGRISTEAVADEVRLPIGPTRVALDELRKRLQVREYSQDEWAVVPDVDRTIHRMLRDRGPLTKRMIINVVSPPNEVNNALNRLKRGGHIQTLKRGVYSIPGDSRSHQCIAGAQRTNTERGLGIGAEVALHASDEFTRQGESVQQWTDAPIDESGGRFYCIRKEVDMQQKDCRDSFGRAMSVPHENGMLPASPCWACPQGAFQRALWATGERITREEAREMVAEYIGEVSGGRAGDE